MSTQKPAAAKKRVETRKVSTPIHIGLLIRDELKRILTAINDEKETNAFGLGSNDSETSV